MGEIVIRGVCLCGLFIGCAYDVIIDIEGLHVVEDTFRKLFLFLFVGL